jgi:flagellar secretion chaperone FliS
MPSAMPKTYLRTKVLTASPAELRLMLIDGAIRFAESGRDGLECQDYEAAYNGLTRAQSILLELINSLRPEQDPELCEKLTALYMFIYRQLVTASTDRQPEIVNEALGLLRFERETWVMLMERLKVQSPDADGREPGERRAISLQG